MEKSKEIGIALIVNIVAGILLLMLTQDWRLTLIIALVLTTLSISFASFVGFWRVGIYNWSKKRGTSTTFRDCLQNVSSSIDFLASWGGSIPSLTSHIENTFRELAERGCKLRFLLLKPGSPGELKRRQTRGTWPRGQPETDLRWLLHIKESLGPYSANFSIAVYSEEPVWAMVIIDNKEGIIGFYGQGVGRDNPGITVKRNKSGGSFFEPFKMEFERLWNSAEQLHSVEHFEMMLKQTRARAGDGFVFVMTGPSGAGKTTLSRELVKRAGGVPSKTVTTRPPRSGEKTTGQYEYVTANEFQDLMDQGLLLCHTEFCGHRYGLRQAFVYEAIQNRRVLILDTIIPPALLRERLGGQVVITFLVTSTIEELRRRIMARGALADGEMDIRLKDAQRQLAVVSDCDYLVFTDGDAADTTSLLEQMIRTIEQSYAATQSLLPQALAHLQTQQVLGERRLPTYEAN